VVDYLLNLLPSICFDFKISYNAASSEVALFLRNDPEDLRPFLLKRFLFFIAIKLIKKELVNHPGREMKLVKIR